MQWLDIQDNYYWRKEDKQTGNSWGKKLIKHGWSLIQHTWEKRNDKLHSPEIITKLEGFDTLKKAIESEWQLGLHNLPPIEFAHLFDKYHTPTTTCKSLDQMKSWFATVRSGRLFYNDTVLQDECSTKGPLQQWVGLSNKLFPSNANRNQNKHYINQYKENWI